jgi:hypothetical protein
MFAEGGALNPVKRAVETFPVLKDRHPRSPLLVDDPAQKPPGNWAEIDTDNGTQRAPLDYSQGNPLARSRSTRRRLFAHVGTIPNACRNPKRLLSFETELCDGAGGNPNTAARRCALIVRLEFETAEPLSVHARQYFSNLPFVRRAR